MPHEASPLKRIQWFPFRNDNAGTIPAFGVMRITGVEERHGNALYTVDKPSTTFQRLYMINGPLDVPAGGYGSGTFDVAYALCSSSASPAYGESWGAKHDEWKLFEHRPGFFVLGGKTGTGEDQRALVRQQEVTELLARTVSSGTYPTRADAYTAWEIEFVDATFTETAGPGAVTITARDDVAPYQVAHNIYNDPFVPEGTLLKVWRDNNRWWFEYEDEIQIAVLQGTLSEGGSVSVKVQKPGGGDAPGGAVVAWDKLGVMTGAFLHKAYIKWQREHAQYWIIQKECDASVPSVTFTPIPKADWTLPTRQERYRQGSVVMGQA